MLAVTEAFSTRIFRFVSINKEVVMKKRMENAVLVILVAVLSAVLSACGGGGGSSPAATTTVSGIASKGPIKDGKVKVYPLKADGTKGDQIGTTVTTNPDGTYTVNVGSYTGNVLVEVTEGTYTDEATGALNVPNPGLSAAVSGVSGNVSVAVTPLTDIAVKHAGSLTTDNINTGNSLISSMVGVNIVNTIPVDVSVTGSANTATQEQIKYGMALATISRMALDGNTSVTAVITNIKTDLADNKLDTTGAAMMTALNNFTIDTAHNKSGMGINDTTSLSNTINNIKDNAITPQPNNTDLVKAKAMVTDLRTTILSIHNYQGVGAEGIVDTPFKNLATEIETRIKPELTTTMDHIGWIIGSISNISNLQPGISQTVSRNGLTLTVTLAADQKSLTFTIKDGQGSTIDSGTVEVNDISLPTSGTFNAKFKTASGTLTATITYAATLNGQGLPTSITLTGSIKDPGFIELDFSQSGRQLRATFATKPNDPNSIYPTSILVSGLIKTTTAQITGSINVDSIIYSTGSNSPLPKTATIEGSFEALNNGTITGTKFSGKITGAWTNAELFNMNAPSSATNFPQWTASFNGTIQAPSRPTITSSLKVTQTVYQIVNFDISYNRTNSDGTVVFISGSGNHDNSTNVLTANLTNQDGLKITLHLDNKLPKDDRFTGTIANSGSTKQADLYTIKGIPSVKYVDNYLETLI
jgi:hypothetical protein